mmetsp:Transcript_20544/g.44637  ORF Transcript_20544/g.44637 Transcript_20544/m.44637 type:complete len:206 (-) Transcript_20544:390-1007(-)
MKQAVSLGADEHGRLPELSRRVVVLARHLGAVNLMPRRLSLQRRRAGRLVAGDARHAPRPALHLPFFEREGWPRNLNLIAKLRVAVCCVERLCAATVGTTVARAAEAASRTMPPEMPPTRALWRELARGSRRSRLRALPRSHAHRLSKRRGPSEIISTGCAVHVAGALSVKGNCTIVKASQWLSMQTHRCVLTVPGRIAGVSCLH